MQLTEILSELPFYQTNKSIDDITINELKVDHREINKGDLFICIKGFTVDGHDFANKAVENGAVVIIAEKELQIPEAIVVTVPDTSRALAFLAVKYFNYPTEKISLIGITGTNGKTTTTYLLDAIFAESNMKSGLIGTIQSKIGSEIFPVKNTTPDALTLQHIFNKMVKENVQVASMEVSSHALDLGRVFGCEFDIALFTNLSQDHLDYHQDMNDYIRAKSLLFSGLGNGYKGNTKYAVINADDSYSEYIKKSTAQHVVTYGIHSEADVRATNITYEIKGMSFTIVSPLGNMKIHSQLIGKFNIYNMLAATTVAILLKIPFQTIKNALEKISGVNGRFEQVKAGQNFAVIVDYAHTPDSLENVLQTIKGFAEKRIYVVVGAGGDRDRTKRPLMAKIATKYAHTAIFTSDNPRTEDPREILRDMTNTLEDNNYQVIVNRKEAIYHSIQLAEAGDVVLIAGKGHETYQEINGVKHDFDDRIVAKEAIDQKG